MGEQGRDPDRGLATDAARRLGRSGRLDRMATGLDTTYRLRCDSGEVLALRVGGVLPIRRPEAMLSEAGWVRSLQAAIHFRVPEVVSWPDRPILVLEDAQSVPRAVMALSWLPGRQERVRFTRHHARALGRAMAELHGWAATFELPDGGWLKTWDRGLMAGAGDLSALVHVAGPGAMDTVAELEGRMDSMTSELGPDGFGIINADIGPHNTVWIGGVPGLVDFNDSGWGYFAFDLARFLRYLAARAEGAALVESALEGYRAVSDLPEGYRAFGALFGAAADLFLARYLAPQVVKRGPDTAERVKQLVASVAQALGG